MKLAIFAREMAVANFEAWNDSTAIEWRDIAMSLNQAWLKQ